MLSRHETASSSHSVANVLAVPAASNAHTGPAGGDTHRPAQSGGGTPSPTRARISSDGGRIFRSPTSLASPIREGMNRRVADCTSYQAETYKQIVVRTIMYPAMKRAQKMWMSQVITSINYLWANSRMCLKSLQNKCIHLGFCIPVTIVDRSSPGWK